MLLVFLGMMNLKEGSDVEYDEMDDWVEMSSLEFEKVKKKSSKGYMLQWNNNINTKLFNDPNKRTCKEVKIDDTLRYVLLNIANPMVVSSHHLVERAESSCIPSMIDIVHVGDLKFFATFGPPNRDSVSANLIILLINPKNMKDRLNQIHMALHTENYDEQENEESKQRIENQGSINEDEENGKDTQSEEGFGNIEEVSHNVEAMSGKSVCDESLDHRNQNDVYNETDDNRNENENSEQDFDNDDEEDSENELEIQSFIEGSPRTYESIESIDKRHKMIDRNGIKEALTHTNIPNGTEHVKLFSLYDSYNPEWHIHNERNLSFRQKPICMAHECGYQRMKSAIAISDNSIICIEFDSKLNYKVFNTCKFINSRIHKLQWLNFSNTFLASTSNGKIYLINQGYEDGSKKKFNEDSLVTFNESSCRNPVAVWNICKTAILDFAFSPCKKYLATAAKDGYIRIINYKDKAMEHIFKSYYGGITTLIWSQDGKLLLSGGEDDTISIWSFEERRLLARCYGHTSWVSKIVFDVKRCTDRSIRFLSVGQDCRCIVWEYSPEALVTSFSPIKDSQQKDQKEPFIVKKTKEDGDSSSHNHGKNISVPSKKEVPSLEPLKKFYVSPTPCSDITFIDEDTFAIAAWGGKIYSYRCV